MKRADERSIAQVPKPVLALLAGALCLQVAWQHQQPPPVAWADALGTPPPVPALKAAALGETIVLAQLLTLHLQAFDNQPGVSVPFQELDYPTVIR